MRAMQEIWKRIEEGFETIDASALLEYFQPGATEADQQGSVHLRARNVLRNVLETQLSLH